MVEAGIRDQVKFFILIFCLIFYKLMYCKQNILKI